MKRIIGAFLAFLILLTLTSCRKKDERFFDYQDEIRAVSGAYTEDGEEYELTLYFERAEGKRRCRRIEYSAPESLAGASFTLEGDKITAELDGIRIAYSFFEKDSVFRVSRLFDLSEEDIYDIKSEKNRWTSAMGKGKDCVWQAVTDGEGIPVEIIYEDSEITGVFKIENITFFE